MYHGQVNFAQYFPWHFFCHWSSLLLFLLLLFNLLDDFVQGVVADAYHVLHLRRDTSQLSLQVLDVVGEVLSDHLLGDLLVADLRGARLAEGADLHPGPNTERCHLVVLVLNISELDLLVDRLLVHILDLLLAELVDRLEDALVVVAE